jgi:3-(3-hydroxy-phenyl)propionate hydroxylase
VDGQAGWLLPQLGQQFTGVLFCGEQGIDPATRAALDALRAGPIPLKLVVVTRGDAQAAALPGMHVVHDAEGLANARYDATHGTFYLVRPDQHVCARWRQVDMSAVEHALKRALCVEGTA